MKLKKRLALLLAAVMITTLMPTIGFAEDMAASDSSNAAPVFTDMPNNWSTAALKNAVDNGLLKGDDGRLRPGDSLTRAEMASIINRAFGATAKATLKGYQDVHEKSWYYEEMGKALQMGTFQGGGDGLLRPQDPITRQEVFVVMARAFKLSNGSEANLNGFADQARISSWAKPAAAALVDAGYIQGANGRLNPKENITRAEFAKILDSMVTGYVNSPGTVDEVPGGNIIINVPGVALKNLAVKGDLIIGDGVGEGNVSIENVTITGRLVIRGGGENSILITGDSNVDSIIIAKVKGKVRVFTADGTEIGEVLADGSDDVILEGNFANIIIQSNNIVVNAVKAKIGEARIEGNNSTLLVGSGSSVETVRVMGNNITIEGTGSVDRVQVYSANVMVKTMNTAVTAETGSTGVDAAGTSVSTGNIVITRPPATSGGGGSSTPPPPPSDFAGGNGTEASPYQVATAAQLNKVRDHLDKHFIQTADINLGVAPWNQGAGWVPIGDPANPFIGTYNGNGFDISNIFIDRPMDSNLGLFGYCQGAEISNVSILDATIVGASKIGGLVGENYTESIINNCVASVDITASGEAVGGLIGRNSGSITNCAASGSISGGLSAGGLIGTNYYGSTKFSNANVDVTGSGYLGGLIGGNYYHDVEQCYALGNINGQYALGGLIGKQWYGSITDNYAMGHITSPRTIDDYVGGLIGMLDYGEISRCYSTGLINANTVAGPNSYVGGLIGRKNPNGPIPPSISLSYYDTDSSSRSDNDGRGIPLTTAQMTQEVNFSSWDFNEETGIWSIGTSPASYPYLQWQNENDIPYPPSEFAGGSGTLADPYQVATATQLYNVRNHLDKHFIQKADINLGEALWNQGDGWVPIGDSTNPFAGVYNGNGKKIIDLYINRPTEDNIGLFGKAAGGTISDLTLENVEVYGKSFVGALIGINANSHREGMTASCIGAGKVRGTGSYIGGLIGENFGALEYSSFSGQVTGSEGYYYIGGLVGSNNSGDINYAFSTADVSMGTHLGGLVGTSTNQGTIRNSYATGNVSGAETIGGLAGSVETLDAVIENCFSTGATNASGDYAGGLVGFNSSATIRNSYTSGVVSGINNVGGIAGANLNGSVRINNSYSLGIVNGSANVGGVVGNNGGELTGGYLEYMATQGVGVGAGTVVSLSAASLPAIYASMSTINNDASGITTGVISNMQAGATLYPTAFDFYQGSYIMDAHTNITFTAIDADVEVIAGSGDTLGDALSASGTLLNQNGMQHNLNTSSANKSWIVFRIINPDPSLNRVYVFFKAIDNQPPTSTITNAQYIVGADGSLDQIILSGTDFDTVDSIGNEVKPYLDWNKCYLSIKRPADQYGTGVNLHIDGIESALITDSTTLTITIGESMGDYIRNYMLPLEADDTITITSGFLKDSSGNAAATDGIANDRLDI